MPRRNPTMRYLRAGVSALVLWISVAPVSVEAKGSGGYSRPSISVSRPSPRTPSTSTFAPSRPSSNSGSGGYFRPRERTPSTMAPSTSAGDSAITRQSSGDALREMRRRNDAPSQPTTQPSWSRPTWAERDRTPDIAPRRRETQVDDSPSYNYPTYRRRRDYDSDYGSGYAPEPQRRAPPVRPRWAGDPGWTAPAYVNPRVDAGSWNPLMLWFLLDTLSRPGHAEWFRQHRTDPGYVSWRAGANAAAASDSELKTKLDDLDRNLGAALEAPANPAYLPPDVKQADAVAPEGISAWPFVLAILLLAAMGGGWFLLSRRQRRASSMSGPSLGHLANVAEGAVRNKLGKPKAETREPFRVGQVVDLDTTPFLLGQGKLLSEAPKDSHTTVTAVGRLSGLPLTRLYLPDDRFLQVHLSDEGRVDECRLFSLLDTVTPGSADDWQFWLPPGSPGEGGTPEWSIGFPVFETKDGKRWDRVWTPGENQIEPFEATERLQGATGTTQRSLSAMLYARETEVPEPGPAREYLLLAAVTEGSDARVEIHVGIDVDTAGLNLTA